MLKWPFIVRPHNPGFVKIITSDPKALSILKTLANQYETRRSNTFLLPRHKAERFIKIYYSESHHPEKESV